MFKTNRFFIILILLFFTFYGFGQQYSGKVVAISDGDTFTLLTSKKEQVKVRLAEIDTPERAQPYGTRARQALSHLVFGKEVTVEEQDIDRYGRLVGQVYVDGIHVNRKMVQEGMAWVYRQYLEDETLLVDEKKARENKRGLWSLPSTEQVPPWEWRRGRKSSTPVNNKGEKSQSQEFSCEGKKYCSQMVSCDEARFYLEHCGVKTLDGDKDGVPCESLCQ